LTICPGCDVGLPANGWTIDPGIGASAECWELLGDVQGFEMAHASLVGRCHQLTVDAYGAQHAGGDPRAIRTAYSLVGLHLALDRGLTGIQVREAHQRMGRPEATWPAFERPEAGARKTVADVAEAGLRPGSVEGHATAVTAWARAVWGSWSERHSAVAELAERLLPHVASPPDVRMAGRPD
jgi:hypothetical protein